MKKKSPANPMLLEERRQHILSIIRQEGRVLVLLSLTATRRPQAADQEPGGLACKLVPRPRSRSRRRVEPVEPLAGHPGVRQGTGAPLRSRSCNGARSRDSGFLEREGDPLPDGVGAVRVLSRSSPSPA